MPPSASTDAMRPPRLGAPGADHAAAHSATTLRSSEWRVRETSALRPKRRFVVAGSGLSNLPSGHMPQAAMCFAVST